MSEFFVHPTSIVDDNVEIGEGTKIWHFSHIQSGARIGKKCSFGQNVNVSNNVVIGNGVKVQNIIRDNSSLFNMKLIDSDHILEDNFPLEELNGK